MCVCVCVCVEDCKSEELLICILICIQIHGPENELGGTISLSVRRRSRFLTDSRGILAGFLRDSGGILAGFLRDSSMICGDKRRFAGIADDLVRCPQGCVKTSQRRSLVLMAV